MKKKLAGILAAFMVLTMGTTVFAAPSSDKESDLKKEAEQLVTTVESGSNSVVITPAVVATTDLTAAYEYVTEKIGGDTGFTMLAAVELTSATTLPSGGVQIKFSVAGITSGTKNIRIYHKTASGWEIKTPYVGNGYVSATFDSLSPFFVVKYDSTPTTDDGSKDSSTVINNYYNTTNNTYNYTNSNNTTSNSNNTTSNSNSTTSNSNNTTLNSNNSTDSHDTTTTSSSSTTTNAATSKDSTDKKTTTSKKDTDKKTDTKKDTTKKDTTKKDTTKKDTTKTDTTKKDTTSDKSSSSSDSSVKSDNSAKNDNSNKNTQTVTVNVNGNSSNSAKSGASTSTTSPKTGASIPVLPMIAVFTVMGIAICGKKARNL